MIQLRTVSKLESPEPGEVLDRGRGHGLVEVDIVGTVPTVERGPSFEPAL
jgi:hypothetical protein